MTRVGLAAVLTCVLVVLPTGVAGAHHRASTLGQLARPASCLAPEVSDETLCRVDPTLSSPGAAAPSRDGRFLYVSGPYLRYTWGAGEEMASGNVAAYAINHETGALSPLGCLAQGEYADGCRATSGIRGARAMAISPDGRHLYLAAGSPGGVTVFALAEDGRLAPAGCVNAEGSEGCAPGPASLERALEVEVSQDGRNVYAASATGSAITIFARASETGALTPLGCVSDGGSDESCADAHALRGVESLEGTADGTRLYASGQGGTAVFARDSEAGMLTQTGCINGYGAPTACARHLVGGPVALAPGSDDLYGALRSAAFFGLRTRSNGFAYHCVPPFGALDCESLSSYFDHAAIAASDNGASIYGAWFHVNTGRGGRDVSALADMARDPRTGRLRYLGCIGDAATCLPGPVRIGALAAVPDSDLLYALGPQVTALGPAVGVATGEPEMRRDGTVRLRLECPAARVPSCAGKLTLRSVRQEQGFGDPAPPKIRRGVLLGATEYELPASSLLTVELTVRERWRAAVRRQKSLDVLITASDRERRTEPSGRGAVLRAR